MIYELRTKNEGELILIDEAFDRVELQKDKHLYKFIWVQQGELKLEIDHIIYTFKAGTIFMLTPFYRYSIIEDNSHSISLMFNSEFYCIYGHDHEVSCNGFLFYNAMKVLALSLPKEEEGQIRLILDNMQEELSIRDNLQEEMLRILLKRLIIIATRLVRQSLNYDDAQAKQFDLVRQFYVLVDQHFREKKQVQDYAEMLHKSPKTLSNFFAKCGQDSPLAIIQKRLFTEARRLVLDTDKNVTEIAYLLGFEDNTSFSRFFRRMSGDTVLNFRRKEQKGRIDNN